MDTTIHWSRTALVIGDHVTEIDLVAKLRRIRNAAMAAKVPVMYSRVEITEEEYRSMSSRNGLQKLMKERQMCVPGKGGRYYRDFEPEPTTILLSARKGPRENRFVVSGEGSSSARSSVASTVAGKARGRRRGLVSPRERNAASGGETRPKLGRHSRAGP